MSLKAAVPALAWLGMLALAACTTSPPVTPPFPWPSPTPDAAVHTIGGGAPSEVPNTPVIFAGLQAARGIPHSTIEAVFQDSHGYIWFATHRGAERFDGYEFVSFHHEPQDPNSLRGDVIYSIAEDADGGLWFATQTGLDRLDTSSGSFAHVDLGTSGGSSGRSLIVTTLMVDDAGHLWAGTHAGVFRLVVAHGQITAISEYDSLQVGNDREQGILAASLYQDSAGTIWAGTQHGLARLDPQSDSFARVPSTFFTASSAITQPARQAEYAAAGLYAPFIDTPVLIQAIAEVKPGLLLLGGESLTLYNTRANTAYPLDAQQFGNAPANLQSSRVWSMLRDASGMIWIGLDTGLARFDPANYRGQFIDYADPETADARAILSILQDAEGNIWLGTAGGSVYAYQPARQKFAPAPPGLARALGDANVWAVTEDHRGYVWIGTETGILRTDRLGGEVTAFPLITEPQGNRLPQSVRALIEDLDGNIWAGAANGKLFIHWPGSEDFDQLFPSQLGTGYPINALHVDRDGDLWIATNNGLYRHSRGSDTVRLLLSEPGRPNSLCHNRVLTIQEDASGLLWLGTWNGICSFDKKTAAFSRIDPAAPESVTTVDAPVFSILADGAGSLWFAGQMGAIQRMDLTTGRLRSYSDPEGATVGLVYGMLQDDQGNLWFSTPQGLSSLDPHAAAFSNYSREDGLPVSVFNMGAYAKGSDGTVFFGGRGGLVSFSPENVPRNPYRPPVVITQLTQGGAPLAPDRRSADPEHVTIAWPNNYFEFEFAALSYARAEDNRYAYYLEGVDQSWVSAGKNRRGRYANLHGGDYVLHLSAANNDGIWNSDGAHLRITVVPPLWQRRWIQVVGILAVLGIALAGYRYRVRSIIKRSRELEALVQERTSQLTGMNQELRQVVDKRKEAEQRLAQRVAAEAVMIERNRLARDLHDAVTQTIFSASILSETLPHTLDANPVKARQQIGELHRLTQGALAELRSLLVELRPEGLVRADLADLLGQLCRGIGGRTGIPVELTCNLTVDVPSEVKITLYRIAQEGLNNASRHADPSHISVECSSDQARIRLHIQDDGRGFDSTKAAGGRMGLGIMAERAADIGANLAISSTPGGGTDIMVEWLFPREADSDERQ